MSGFIGESRNYSKHKSAEWYTPKWVFDYLDLEFDLDPSSPHDMRTEVPAKTKYTVLDNGLNHTWFGRVWLNPPYGQSTPTWIRRMIEHNNGVALVFSRTDTAWCQEAMKAATAMLFIAGRIDFIPGHENAHKKSRCGAGTVIFAFGSDCAKALNRMSHLGVFMEHNKCQH